MSGHDKSLHGFSGLEDQMGKWETEGIVFNSTSKKGKGARAAECKKCNIYMYIFMCVSIEQLILHFILRFWPLVSA